MIVFCTTCKERVQHIQQTLPKNIADNGNCKNLKFLILDYNSSDNLVNYLQSNYSKMIENERLVFYRFTEPIPFRMAHAKNLAHRLGILEKGDILVNLDADNFTHENFANYVDEKFQSVTGRDTELFLWSGIVQGKGKKYRGCSGRIVVSSRAFLNAGGYDEKFNTWAPDDKDFNARLHRLGYSAVEIDKKYLEAIPHNDNIRFKEYPHITMKNSEDEFVSVNALDTTIANFGKFGNGVVFRNFESNPIELTDVPTRVFGIGMHKTATNSLNTALNLLGFDSVHWRNPGKAKEIWLEMRNMGRSPSLEKHYALTDLPGALLYKEFDKAYPGSKFVLTVRNEKTWLESIKNHWSYEHNQYRASWDTDPITHKLHNELYGRKDFNADIFLTRYRKHNADVKEYFKGRIDLLVMDMDRSANWLQLCGFLRKPIPTVPYPIDFVTHIEGKNA
jgi:sulfotransferase family protein